MESRQTETTITAHHSVQASLDAYTLITLITHHRSNPTYSYGSSRCGDKVRFSESGEIANSSSLPYDFFFHAKARCLRINAV